MEIIIPDGSCKFSCRTVITILCSIFLAVAPHPTSAQQEETVTLTVRNESLATVLSMVQQQTPYRFTYRDAILPTENNISISADRMTIEQFLTAILEGTQLTYQRNGLNFSLVRESASNIEISGTVVDEDGTPMPGVTILIRNSTRGITSDNRGQFRINAPSNAVLVVNFLGYREIEVPVNNRTNIQITMRQDAQDIEDVVVIGYGSMRKSDLTGAVVGMGQEEIQQSQALSFVNAMQGRLAGVQISSSSGELGVASRIVIRGSNSIYGSSLPLYVIDGIQIDADGGEIAGATLGGNQRMDPLASINPADIEDIQVLKDASATAIYGSRGANGVIIVTTRSGRAGQFRVSYDGNVNVGFLSKRLDILNSSDYIDYRREVQWQSPLFYEDTNGDNAWNLDDQAIDPYSFPSHDWQKEMTRAAVSHNHNVSIDGGTDKTQYSTSVGYTRQQGIIMDNSLQRITARAKIDNRPFRRLRIGTNFLANYTTYEGASHSGGGIGYSGIVQQMVTSSPIEIATPEWTLMDEYVSPLSMLKEAHKLNDHMRTQANVNLSYEIIDDLFFNAEVGGIMSSSKGTEFYGSNTLWGAGSINGSAAMQEIRVLDYSTSEQLNYRKTLENHRIDAMVAFELSHNDYQSFVLRNSDYLDQSTGVWNMGKGTQIDSYGTYKGINNRVSFLGRVFYDFKSRYLFTVSMRIDGSDKFGPGNRYGYFPSGAFAWRVSEEPFIKNTGIFDNLKLRLSYGVTGNERISSYQYMATLGNVFYNGQLGVIPDSNPNRDLKWETTTQYNAGLDVGVVKNRINISVDGYVKQTRDMLMPATVPAQTGFSTQWQNIGRVDNYGIEFSITSVNIQRNDFQWITDFNISTNRNEIKNLGGVDYRAVNVGGNIQQIGRIYVGNQIGTMYGYVFDGIYQLDEFTWQNNSDPTIPHNDRNYVPKIGTVTVNDVADIKPGAHKFKDLDGNGVIDQYDQLIIGRSSPKFFGGINNTFRYKGIELAVFLSGMYGNQIFNTGRYSLEGYNPTSWFNVSRKYWKNRWTVDNPSNKYGNFATQMENPTANSPSSYYIEDASFLRLKNISLSYNLPQRFIDRIQKSHISNIKVYVTAENLYTWTKYSGFDPEIDSGNALLPGVDNISYPRTRNVTFGVNLTF